MFETAAKVFSSADLAPIVDWRKAVVGSIVGLEDRVTRADRRLGAPRMGLKDPSGSDSEEEGRRMSTGS